MRFAQCLITLGSSGRWVNLKEVCFNGAISAPFFYLQRELACPTFGTQNNNIYWRHNNWTTRQNVRETSLAVKKEGETGHAEPQAPSVKQELIPAYHQNPEAILERLED